MVYKFEILYKPDKENRVADTLSRKGQELELKAMSVWQYDDLENWEDEVKKDEKLLVIWQKIITCQHPLEGYTIKNGCLESWCYQKIPLEFPC